MTVRREATVLAAVFWLVLCALTGELMMALLPAFGIDSWEQQFWVSFALSAIVGWLYSRFYVQPLRRRLERRDD